MSSYLFFLTPTYTHEHFFILSKQWKKSKTKKNVNLISKLNLKKKHKNGACRENEKETFCYLFLCNCKTDDF